MSSGSWLSRPARSLPSLNLERDGSSMPGDPALAHRSRPCHLPALLPGTVQWCAPTGWLPAPLRCPPPEETRIGLLWPLLVTRVKAGRSVPGLGAITGQHPSSHLDRRAAVATFE